MVFLYCQRQIGKSKEFFLFGSYLVANMIDKKLADKPICFEMTIGTLSLLLFCVTGFL